MRYGILAMCVLALAGAARAGEAGGERPPFQGPRSPAEAELLRRFEEMDVLAHRIAPDEVVGRYRALHRDALAAYGTDAYEPYAVLDRLAGFYADRAQTSSTPAAGHIAPPEEREAILEGARATRREIVESLGKSGVAGWRRRGEIAKQEGMLALEAGDLEAAASAMARAAKDLGEHPSAAEYSLARVVLAEVQVAVGRGRWDEAEGACDRLFRVFHEKDARSMDQLDLDILSTAEGLAGYHLAYSLARRRADEPGKAAKYAEWNLNAKVYRREVFARQLATLAAAEGGPVAEARDKLRGAWRRLAALAVQPARGRVDREAIQKQSAVIFAAFAEVKSLARVAARLTAPAPGEVAPWVTIDQVRAALPADSVLIDVVAHLDFDFDAPPGSLAWKSSREVAYVIPPAGRGEVRMVDLGDEAAIWRSVDAYVRTAALPVPDDPEARREAAAASERVSRDVSRVILNPLLPHVRDARRWVVCPQGLTWLVPWATMIRDDGDLVVEHHATSYVLAGRHVLRKGSFAAGPAPTPAPPLIVADPDYDQGAAAGEREGVPFAPLPGTLAEARAIAPHLEAYAKAPPRILTQAAARESAALAAPAPRVFVASTHGYYGRLPDVLVGVTSAMLRCGLAFSGANPREAPARRPGDDGVATGLEILASDFRGTELVVLSACETSYGEFQTSQGVIGLNLAFHLAGARTVLGALWYVPVDETTALTTKFFAELARGQPGDEALRRSQVALVKKLRERDGVAPPWFWGSFLLTGDGLSVPAAP